MKTLALLLLPLACIVGSCNFSIWQSDTRYASFPAGFHYPIEPQMSRPELGPMGNRLTVTFDSSCIYSQPQPHQASWNKLWGYAWLGTANQSLTQRVQDTDSFRFGWRWNPATQYIEVNAFVFDRAKRESDHILTRVRIGQPVELWLQVDYFAKTYNTPFGKIPFTHNKRITTGLNPYFGGEKSAPHLVVVKMVFN